MRIVRSMIRIATSAREIHERGGHLNPQYETTFVFTNDFAALLPDTPEYEYQDRMIKSAERTGH